MPLFAVSVPIVVTDLPGGGDDVRGAHYVVDAPSEDVAQEMVFAVMRQQTWDYDGWTKEPMWDQAMVSLVRDSPVLVWLDTGIYVTLPTCASCGEEIPPGDCTEHCLICEAPLCNLCHTASARCPDCEAEREGEV